MGLDYPENVELDLNNHLGRSDCHPPFERVRGNMAFENRSVWHLQVIDVISTYLSTLCAHSTKRHMDWM
jgi:hypothetical protein